MGAAEPVAALDTGAASSLLVPRLLPERHDGTRLRSLSVSSMKLLERCPERFRRRYLCGEHEPTNGPMLVGRAVGQAVTAYYAAQIEDGTRLAESDADDVLLAGFDEGAAATDFGDDEPGELTERARSALRAYLNLLAPSTKAATLERRVETGFEGAEWSFLCYLDIEDEQGDVIDLKVGKAHVTQQKADRDMQASAYLLARLAEGRPARRFRFHSVVTKEPRAAPQALEVETERSRGQLALFERRIARAARLIERYSNGGDWPLSSPEGWWCSASMCAFWENCEGGGRGYPE
jgi:RecB family exonuclease